MLIYGATGYTGALVVEAALARGLRPILGGRNTVRLETTCARSTASSIRAALLTDAAALARLLTDVDVLLLAAGRSRKRPFRWWTPVCAGGFTTSTCTGECAVIEALSHRGAEARRRACMVMPGCGFDVVASDCLASHVARRLPRRVPSGNRALRTGDADAGLAADDGRAGGTAPSGRGETAVRPFHQARCGAASTTGTETAGAPLSAGATSRPRITPRAYRISRCTSKRPPTFRAMLLAGRTLGPLLQLPLAQAYMKAHAPLFPEGPTATERAVHTCVIVAEARAGRGEQVTSRLRTPEAYSMSAQTASAIAQRALRGDVEPGFQTPARVYGCDFILQFQGVVREHLDHSSSIRRDGARHKCGQPRCSN